MSSGTEIKKMKAVIVLVVTFGFGLCWQESFYIPLAWTHCQNKYTQEMNEFVQDLIS